MGEFDILGGAEHLSRKLVIEQRESRRVFVLAEADKQQSLADPSRAVQRSVGLALRFVLPMKRVAEVGECGVGLTAQRAGVAAIGERIAPSQRVVGESERFLGGAERGCQAPGPRPDLG